MANHFHEALHAGLPPLHPLGFPLAPPPPPPPHPPPPPPPRSRRTSSFSLSVDGSNGPFERLMNGQANIHNAQQYERPRSSSAMSSHSQDADVEKCSRCGDTVEAMQRLEAKLMSHVARVEIESQTALKAIITEVNKMQSDREISWKHVAELKEQNRLLRQRAYDLEKQNGQFIMHISALQERLSTFAEVAGQLQALQGQVQVHPTSTSLLPGMPKVPHSGADIW